MAKNDIALTGTDLRSALEACGALVSDAHTDYQADDRHLWNRVPRLTVDDIVGLSSAICDRLQALTILIRSPLIRPWLVVGKDLKDSDPFSIILDVAASAPLVATDGPPQFEVQDFLSRMLMRRRPEGRS